MAPAWIVLLREALVSKSFAGRGGARR
jgi:hypothetical protein